MNESCIISHSIERNIMMYERTASRLLYSPKYLLNALIKIRLMENYEISRRTARAQYLFPIRIAMIELSFKLINTKYLIVLHYLLLSF